MGGGGGPTRLEKSEAAGLKPLRGSQGRLCLGYDGGRRRRTGGRGLAKGGAVRQGEGISLSMRRRRALSEKTVAFYWSEAENDGSIAPQ